MFSNIRKSKNLLNYSIIGASVFFTLSFVNKQLSFICFAFLILSILYLSMSNGFALLLFASSFVKVFHHYSWYFYFMLIGLAILVFKAICLNKSDKWINKTKTFKIVFITCLLFLIIQPIVFSVINRNYSLFVFCKLYIFILFFVFIYFAFNKIDKQAFVRYFVLGIITSCCLALLGNSTGLIIYDRLFMEDSQGIFRFSAITAHPNSLARFCLIGISMLIYYISKSKKYLPYIIPLICLLAFACLTYSKTTIVVVLLMIIITSIYSFIKIKDKRKWVKYFTVIASISLIIVAIFFPYFCKYMKRFVAYCQGDGLLNKITTGRVDIWKKFLKSYISSPLSIIWGKSYFRELPVNIGAHNSFLALLYQYGLLGSIILFIFIFTIIKNTKKYSKNFLAYLPIGIIFLMGIIEDQILTHNGCIMWGIALLILQNNDAINSKTRDQDDNKINKQDDECLKSVEGVINNQYTNCNDEMKIIRYEFYLFVKRFLDIIISSVALLILGLPMLIVALCVKLSSKGPVLFKDKRIGLNGKMIKVYKFRSMYVDAESRLEQYLTKEQLDMWKKERKIENDPRITKIGKFIRKTSIDELPQLINILKGDLSIVGNRPISPLEYDTWYNDKEKALQNKMRPGLTGYWQVYGRSGVTYESGKRQMMCKYYINNASLMLDVRIFLKTFYVVIFKKGAK